MIKKITKDKTKELEIKLKDYWKENVQKQRYWIESGNNNLFVADLLYKNI